MWYILYINKEIRKMDFLHISRGSGKMKGLDSLNTDNTIIDFCKKMYHSKNKNIICVDCYAWRMLLRTNSMG